MMRSKLFVPGNRPELFLKALDSAADAVCFDLEDSVPPDQKQQARASVQALLGQPIETAKKILVRVNSPHSAFFAEDLRAALQPDVSLLVLPKIEDESEIQAVDAAMSQIEKERGMKVPIPVLPTIESPRGLRLARQIASGPRIAGLQLGLLDMFATLRIARDDEAAGRQIRLAVRLAAGEVGVPCYDSAAPDFTNLEVFRKEAGIARGLGYSGKSCIHPRQIEPANQIFSPTAGEISHAREIVLAARERAGAFAFRGSMVDAPVLRHAEDVLRLARELGME